MPRGVVDQKMLDLAIASDHMKHSRYDEALAISTKVLNEDPNSAAALYMVAWAMIKGKKSGIAYTLLKRSIELRPKHEAYNNLGMACIELHRLDEARKMLLRCLESKPDYQYALNNLALVAIYEGDPDTALRYVERSLASNPSQVEAREQSGYANLLLGNFEEGWRGYEAMVNTNKFRKLEPPHDGCPYWMGEEGLDLFIGGEQGIGDEIAFASILPDVLRRSKSVTLECNEKLGGLFARSFPDVAVSATRWNKDRAWVQGRQFDAHALIGTLAHHYRKSAQDFPGTPYLTPDPERCLQWRALFQRLRGPKVGIAWTGGTHQSFKERRSFTLEQLLPILKTPNVHWVSLQYQNPVDEIEAFGEKHGISLLHWKRGAESADYDDQAAMVAELDLVVSVCTSVVHLAGALGKPCLTLVPAKPPYFFGMDGSTIPWYKSVELFRQHRETQEWPLREVAAKIKEWARVSG